jgi:multiple sugar transport system permease protein
MTTVQRSDPDRLGKVLMVMPYTLGLLLLIAIPAAMTVVMAFTDADLISRTHFIGFDNFKDLWNDGVFILAMRNSLSFILWSVPLRLLGAFGLALLLHRRARGVGAERTAVFLPTVMPDVAYALVWLWILNPLYGPLNAILRSLGLQPHAWLSQPGPARAAVVIMSLFQIGEGFVIALAVRQMIPPSLYEVARVEGAGAWQAFRRITFPLMLPALLLLVVRDTVFSFQTSFVPALLVTNGGPPPYSTTYLPLFVYRNAFEYLRYGYASAATVVMLVTTASIVWLQYDLISRWSWRVGGRDQMLLSPDSQRARKPRDGKRTSSRA